MSISSTTRKAGPSAGNGVTTAFPFTFKVFATSDVLVVQTAPDSTETTLTLTTDYTVTLNSNQDSNPGGTVTMNAAPTTGYSITIGSQVPYTQGVTLTNQGGFFPTVINDALDKITILVQQMFERLNRALTLPFSAPSGTSTTLPVPVANMVIGWNTAGNGLVNVNAESLLTVAGSSGFSYQTFNGGAGPFTLSASPGAIGNCEVFVGGVRQRPVTDYTLVGTTLTPTSAWPIGSSNVLVRWGTTLGIGVPSDGSVTAAKFDQVAVTPFSQSMLSKTSAAAWKSTLGTAGSGANTDITSLGGLTTPLSVAQGGTGATTLTGLVKGNGTSAMTAAAAGTDYVAPGAATGSGLLMNPSKLIGRTTAGAGALEEISVGTGLTLSAGSLSVSNTGITLGTPTASTSGTSVDFTIPTTAKRVVLMGAGVSTNNTSTMTVRLNNGSVLTTGYVSVTDDGGIIAASTNGFQLGATTTAMGPSRTYTLHLMFSLENATNNTWVCHGMLVDESGTGTTAISVKVLGRISLGAGTPIAGVRLTTVGGTNTFDAGELNVQYE